MTHILKNKNLEIHIDSPLENYNHSRFDWTGKIVKVKFQNILISGNETINDEENIQAGKGFYNEFGIDTPLGFDEANIGDWFHKIGVGLLKKDNNQYLFHKEYEIDPAEFKIKTGTSKISVECISATNNGYAYILKKEIELLENSFTINYYLKNTGEKTINTNEYNHNFISINNEFIGADYILKFPFQLKPQLFEETVNPEGKVEIGQQEIKFNGQPKEQFFFSNLSGDENVNAKWELTNLKNNIGIRETGSFQTNKINLWGYKHVICPELFFNIALKPGQSTAWSRTYHIFKTL